MAQTQDLSQRPAAGSHLRILMLLENNSYPEDVRVRREAESLVGAGYRVSVIAPRGPQQPLTQTVRGVRVYRYPAPPRATGFLGYLWEYGYSMVASFLITFAVWVREGFDVIHAHNPPDTFFLVAAPYKLIGKKFVFDHHDLSPEMYEERFGRAGAGIVNRTLLWLENLSLRTADHVIATNESYKRLEMSRGGVPEERITVVRNGPDLAKFQRVPPDPELRAKARFLIGYVGVIAAQDGLDYLLRALAHLRDELGREDFYCVIIGDGSALTEIRRMTDELGLADHMLFTGSLFGTDLVRCLCSVDICVDPDPSNAYNDCSTMIKITEYMALEKPIVAFDLPEHRFSAGEAAVYVVPNEEPAFAEALADLMDDPKRREAMGTAGRKRVESRFSWQHSAENLLSVYDRLASRPTPRATTERRARPGATDRS